MLSVCRGTNVTDGSQTADVGEALELLRKIVFVEHRVRTVFHHLQRHCTENRCKLVDALRSGGRNTSYLLKKHNFSSF